MKWQTCNSKGDLSAKGVIQPNMKVVLCPDCRDGASKLWLGLNYEMPVDVPIITAHRLN